MLNPPHVIFYVGVPLTTSGGLALGTLCVIDHEPRQLQPYQLDSLRSLANQVVKLFELRRKNLELKKLQIELESKNEALEQFAYVVAHDIKSPLSNIAAVTSLIDEEYEQQKDAFPHSLIKHLNQSSNRLIALVDATLAYYKTDSHLKEECENLELSSFFKSLADLLDANGEHQIIYPINNVVLRTNKSALERIFINLIDNGIKYNHSDLAKIDISFEEREDFYRFRVKDNGMGMKETELPKIFALFTTLGQKDRSGIVGTGIGLASVKKLVESLGGAISVTSKIGEGTTFGFTIGKSQFSKS